MFKNIDTKAIEENWQIWQTSVEEAIFSNPDCGGNILLVKRVFCQESVVSGELEVLVSLRNKTSKPHYWGHIFFKEGHYFVTIIAIDRWLNPPSSSALFQQFWYEIEVQGNWHPIGGDVFAVTENFSEALDRLRRMISVFSEKDAINTTSYCDYRVVAVYPFPDPFKEKVSLEEWKKERSLNAQC